MYGPAKYKGIIHCLKTSVALEGWQCLTRGLTTTVIRAFPTNAATFAVVNWTLDLFKTKEEEEENNSLKLINELKSIEEKVITSASTPITLVQTIYDEEVKNFENNSNNDNFKQFVQFNYINNISQEYDEINKNNSDQQTLFNLLTSKTKTAPNHHECDSHQVPPQDSIKYPIVPQAISDGSFCRICGRCLRRGAQLIFNTSNSLKCLTLRHQTFQ